MRGKVGRGFVFLAVFLCAGLIFGDDPKHSPGQVIEMLAMAGLALLVLLGIVTAWGWFKRRLSRSNGRVPHGDADADRADL